MANPRSETVLAMYDFMQGFERTELKVKSECEEMVVVASLLDCFGIIKKDTFLNDYTTTLNIPGLIEPTTIFTNFKLGVEVPGGRDLWTQMRTIAHEKMHARQISSGVLVFDARYLESPYRAWYESHAFIVNCEMDNWRWGPGAMPDPDLLAARLKSYACKQVDIDQAAATYKRLQWTVKMGGIVSESFAALKPFLDTEGAYIREVA